MIGAVVRRASGRDKVKAKDDEEKKPKAKSDEE